MAPGVKISFVISVHWGSDKVNMSKLASFVQEMKSWTSWPLFIYVVFNGVLLSLIRDGRESKCYNN